MNRNIYLIRHGKIDFDKKRYIGMTDLPLSDAGIEQANWLKEYFDDIHIEKAYSSPLSRCLLTSEIILEDRDIERIVVNELREINMGDWENKSFEYIKERFREQYEKRGDNIDSFVPPGGESFAQLQKRVIPAFERLIGATSGNILVVAHAGVNRVILSTLLDFPLKEIQKIDQPYACINRLSRDNTTKKWALKQKYLEA